MSKKFNSIQKFSNPRKFLVQKATDRIGYCQDWVMAGLCTEVVVVQT